MLVREPNEAFITTSVVDIQMLLIEESSNLADGHV